MIDALADLLALEGHGFFVWGSYTAAALLVAIEPWLASRRRRQALRDAVTASDDER